MQFIRVVAFVTSLIVVAACAVTSSSVVAEVLPQPPAADPKVPGPTVSDPGDFYYFDGKPVPLDRATSEFVIGIASDTDAAQLLQGAAVPATAGAPMMIRGRRFLVVTVAAAPAGSMTRLIEAMRRRSDVWFASPIYYHPATRARVVPTDELIVRTKASVTPAALQGVLQARGLRRVALVEGTTDQYVVRIESAKNADVLRASRELYDSGLLQWAEPDFIQEYRRQG